MELLATVNYKEGLASFRIQCEVRGIYYAYLVSYSGTDYDAPPNVITLVKGFRHWTGSFPDPILLQLIGDEIETYGIDTF